MMSATLQMHGPMFIPRVKQTLLVALSAPPLPIQPMAFPVQFVVVDTGVQRKSKQNSYFC
jgi:hypothetical protein